MDDIDPSNLVAVAAEHDHCHKCGAEVGTREFQGRDRAWCPECDLVFMRKPVPGSHVVVHDGEHVLLLDEDIPQHEGLWSLPGGFAEYGEGPKETAVRELQEETDLRADPADLSILDILHAEFPHTTLWLVAYELDRADTTGELTPEFEGFEAAFHHVEEIRAADDRIRDSDLERIEMALDG